MIPDGGTATLARTVVIAVVVAALAFSTFSAATSDEMGAYINQSEDWCQSHNGELVNVQSVIHGGLHCDLPNGTSIHMSDVVEVEES